MLHQLHRKTGKRKKKKNTSTCMCYEGTEEYPQALLFHMHKCSAGTGLRLGQCLMSPLLSSSHNYKNSNVCK